jgi:hypothetical protein
MNNDELKAVWSYLNTLPALVHLSGSSNLAIQKVRISRIARQSRAILLS